MRGAKPAAALEATFLRALAPVAGETVLLAVSGGPDSVALAALGSRCCATAGVAVVLGYVDHGVRDARQDEAVVLAAGAQLGLRVRTARLQPGPPAEARLREERYAALAGMARAAGARRVVTAHHAADQTETVLLALFRGAGPAGACGMAPRRELEPGIELVRPLLAVEPARLHAYGLAAHLPHALDPTNDDLAYRRNAVRAALPALRASFPHLDAAVARYAAIVASERAGSPEAVARERLRAQLVAVTGDARDVTFERLDRIAEAIERGAAGRHFVRRGVEVVVR